MNDQPITLGELIELLATRPATNTVVFDTIRGVPFYVGSYRGYYDHLAIGYRAADPRAPVTVGDLLRELRNADGAVFEGYKGGDFRMTRATPMWVSNYGSSDSIAVTGIRGYEGTTIITTAKCEDWAGGMERARRVIFEGLGFGNLHLP